MNVLDELAKRNDAKIIEQMARDLHDAGRETEVFVEWDQVGALEREKCRVKAQYIFDHYVFQRKREKKQPGDQNE